MENYFSIVINACNQKDWISKCIESCLSQDYDNFEVLMVDALSDDQTFEIAKKYENNSKFKLFQNEKRVPQIANISFLTKNSKEKSIIVTVDGDDHLINSKVLNKLNTIYSDSNVWMTYGNFVNSRGQLPGWVYAYPESVISNNWFREYDWLATHLRTYRRELFLKIDEEDFKRDGEWMVTTGDQAFMIPMLEMSGARSKFIPEPLYVYNDSLVSNDTNTNRHNQIEMANYIRRNKKKYKTISSIW